MGNAREVLEGLYEACLATPPCLLPKWIREGLIQCCIEFGHDPPHSDDDSTPEVLLSDAARKILGLLENLEHFGGDRLVNRTHFGAENGPTWETI